MFRLPPRRFGLEWELVLSTAAPDCDGPSRLPGAASALGACAARSLVLRVRSRLGIRESLSATPQAAEE